MECLMKLALLFSVLLFYFYYLYAVAYLGGEIVLWLPLEITNLKN